MFPSLVGLSCIWVSPYSDVMSNSACCTSRSGAPVLISIFTQSISGQLKSPVIMTCLGFPFVNLSRESLRLSRSFMFLCGSNRNSNSSQKAVDQIKPNLTRMALFKKIIHQTSDFNYNYIEACTNKGSRVYESKPWRSKFLHVIG